MTSQPDGKGNLEAFEPGSTRHRRALEKSALTRSEGEVLVSVSMKLPARYKQAVKDRAAAVRAEGKRGAKPETLSALVRRLLREELGL